MNEPHVTALTIGGEVYHLTDLTEFNFKTARPLPEQRGAKLKGTLALDEESIDVDFRVREKHSDFSVCSFSELSLQDKERIKRFLVAAERKRDGADDLASRSYDELAQGIGSNDSATSESEATAAQTGSFAKTAALLLLLAVMAGLAVGTMAFLKSRSSLTVSNSSLVGNYLAINTRVAGEVEEVFVQEGDYVKQGDVLMRLSNREVFLENDQYRAELEAARMKVEAMRDQLEQYESKMELAAKKLQLDLDVARSQLKVAQKSEAAARAALKALEPYVKSGAVTQLELDEATRQLLLYESECETQKNLIRKIEFSLKASTESNIYLAGDRIDNESGRIEAELRVAEAELQRLEKMVKLTDGQVDLLDIVAPRDGQVFAAYHQKGEYLKEAQEAIALSHPGKTWAFGHVTASQAARVRPGQPVVIKCPTHHLQLKGVVAGIGHRAVYSKGGYNAEFRGTTATDVPVKVIIKEMPDDLPAGIRLEMAIKTGFGVEWLDNWMDYRLEPIVDPDSPRKVVTQSSARRRSAERKSAERPTAPAESEASDSSGAASQQRSHLTRIKL